MHALGTAIFQQSELIVGLEDSRDLINHVADLDQLRVRRSGGHTWH
jgi:hypothetical protein